jgi:hypothetical protein
MCDSRPRTTCGLRASEIAFEYPYGLRAGVENTASGSSELAHEFLKPFACFPLLYARITHVLTIFPVV